MAVEFGRLPSSLLNEGGGPLMAVDTKTTELTALDALPAVLSVEEAAALLRIGRTAAYALTRVARAACQWRLLKIEPPIALPLWLVKTSPSCPGCERSSSCS